MYLELVAEKREATIPATFYPGIHCLLESHNHTHRESSSPESGTLKTVRKNKKQKNVC